MTIVIKRDGTKQPFDYKKIERAVFCAFRSVNNALFKRHKELSEETQKDDCPDEIKKEYEKISNEVEKVKREVSSITNKVRTTLGKCKTEEITVEEIQDVIQKELITSNKYDVVESFILYRRKRQETRESKSELVGNIKKALNASDIQNQNANVDEASYGGRFGEAARVASKYDAMKNWVSKKARKNHEDGFVYIHDLDSYSIGMHNCLTIPFDRLLKEGFTTRQTDVRKASSVNTAFQLVAVLFQLQSLQQFGGVSASHLDWTMVPYVRKSFYKHYNNVRDIIPFLKPITLSDDFVENTEMNHDTYRGKHWWNLIKRYTYKKALKLTNREVYQAVEGMYHNLNTLQSRSGNQLPFTSINYGTCTNQAGRMVIKALLDVSLKGLGKYHRTSIFPCGIFQYMKGVNDKEGTPNYDLFRLALKSTAKRIYPNYANVDWTGNAGYDRNNPETYFSTMGCHARGTKIVMADGTRKNVEDIVVGDKLAGVNNGVRTVQKLIQGVGKMYKVEQSRGETYIVNDGHILALEYSSNRKYKGYKKGDKVNMTINEFLSIPESSRRFFKGYKSSYELEEKEYDIPPFSTSTLKITELPEDEFFGFELDGDKLYLLDDYTVTHNCRTANGLDINGLGQLKDGRGNICPATIILPTVAIESKLKAERIAKKEGRNFSTEDVLNEFFKLLGIKLGDTKDTLIERFNHICSQSPDAAKFMWENNTMAGYKPEEGIISALKHGTLAIGQLGLAEALQILIGTDHTTDKGMDLAIQIEKFIREHADKYKKEYSLNFGVYYTPAENLCYTAMKKFRTKYGVIPNVSDREYFTNSMHVPVWHDIDPFKKIEIESKLTGFSNAGCITYVELPSTAINNIDAVETIVVYMMEHDIPYGAINFPLDSCNVCHAQGDFNGICPECGSTDIDELRRVTGYLSTTKKHFNKGKQSECDDRAKHIKG